MKFSAVLLFLLLFLLPSCNREMPKPVEEGVSRDLARTRKLDIRNIVYSLNLDIPQQKSDPIKGQMGIQFDWAGLNDLILDFQEDSTRIISVIMDHPINYNTKNGHIIIPKAFLQKGLNTVNIEFIAGDLSLNRNNDFLYTLFVPDRASTAFPLFDQPDLKAKFNLQLTIPKSWVAIANGETGTLDSTGAKTHYIFRETNPLPTYLFSFVAGKFSILTSTRNGRTLTMLHRETDSVKVARNADQIFDLHFKAIAWLENYTGIPYPFQKFGFVLIPSFQYGGMEHPGAILYNANSLFLEESHTQQQLLGRASVIAHETSHMWFGDLVTMQWFNDVWMKEVFANFMAAKIMNPAFPDINHNLRFLMAHYPAAYGVDRTAGANPIQQPLNNLKNAGQMYGAIIYQKAPVVMKHLEALVGDEIFRRSLQEYLEKYSYGNADWDDLVNIIDENSPEDVKCWSEAWVKEAGMPILSTGVKRKDGIPTLTIKQDDTLSLRPQPIAIQLITNEKQQAEKIYLGEKEKSQEIPFIPNCIIPNTDGFSYGYFELDSASKIFMLENTELYNDPVIRGAIWINLYEGMVRGDISPSLLLSSCENALPTEMEQQNAQYLLRTILNIYWDFLPEDVRVDHSGYLENLLLTELNKRKSSGEKAMFYHEFISVALSKEGIALMRNWWNKSKDIPGLTLSETDYTNLACELALRGIVDSGEILKEQLNRIQNPDRKARMEFVIPSLSNIQAVRDAFFESLKKPVNREHEPWVLEALGYLHHPLRAKYSMKYILPSLDMLEEIQRTGDIFFPSRWLGATFSGHNSGAAAKIVTDFLALHPDYPEKLKEKILQSSDHVYRASAWLDRNPSQF